MSVILGIDLGTTNSAASVLIDGQPKMILVDGQNTMPSCVGLDHEGKILVGQVAKNQLVSSPENTILSIKRLMGSSQKVLLGGKEFSPEEISALILKKLKTAAEQSLGEPIEKVVITVPAYFNETERLATKNAGKLAGLEVVRIINEPTAASIAYDSENSKDEKLLVYDLGGGTFDVSLVVVHNGIVEVKASHGDTKLGGDDFDNLLVDFVIKHFELENSLIINREDARLMNRLRFALEKAKCHLSDNPFVNVKEEFLYEGFHLNLEVTREEYQDLIRPMIEKTMQSIQKCFTESGIYGNDIDKIMLVGGSSRTPLVHEMITQKIGKSPRFEINPDLIVAMGAGIQAGIINGQKSKSILIDITTFTFGTKTSDEMDENFKANYFSAIIPKNSPLPISKSDHYFTPYNNMSEIEVDVYQGESQKCNENEFVGSFWVKGLQEVDRPNEIIATFSLDINGMLEVTALEKDTGLSKTVLLDTKNIKNNINFEESRAKLAELDPFGGENEVDNDSQESDDINRKYKSLFLRFDKLNKEDLADEDVEELQSLLQELQYALENNNQDLIDEKYQSISDLLFYLED